MNDPGITTTPVEEPNPPPNTRKFTVTFDGNPIETTVTSNPIVVDRWILEVVILHLDLYTQKQLVVGLGVYSSPAGSPASVQLCVGTHCLIFQLVRANRKPANLPGILASSKISFVGIDNSNHESLLRSSLPVRGIGTVRYRILDVRDITSLLRGGVDMTEVSREAMALGVLGRVGLVFREEIGGSDWGAAVLSEDQVEYACVEALLSMLMGKEIEAWLWSVGWANTVRYHFQVQPY